MTLLEIKNELINYSQEIGIPLLGFAKAEELTEEIELHKESLKNNYHADMAYLERHAEKKRDVRSILPSAKSVIVAAISYNFNMKHESNSGKIARYAWLEDYHSLLMRRLIKIENKIKTFYHNAETKSYVDTGPIMEKQWAVRAGIGWLGKNSLVINKKNGSYLLLGIIITNIEFPPDTPVKEHCGNCTNCLQACPTKAIIQEKVIDSRNCISYWTIESKTETFPENIRKNLNGNLFGCDICQEVCPWNQKAVKCYDKEMLESINRTAFRIEEIENMTENDFKTIFKNSPIKRCKLSGLKRNAEELKSSLESA